MMANLCYGVRIPRDDIAVAHYTAGGGIIARFLHQGPNSAFSEIMKKSEMGTRDGGKIKMEISLSKYDRKIRTMLSVLRFHGAVGRFKTASSGNLAYRSSTMNGPWIPVRSSKQLWELAEEFELSGKVKEALNSAAERAADGKAATIRPVTQWRGAAAHDADHWPRPDRQRAVSQ